MLRIALSGETRKALASRLQQAYAAHATRLVRRIHALLWLGDGKSIGEVARTLDLGEQTLRDWLHAFILQGLESLHYRSGRGRPPKLTESQRKELKALVLEGPEAAGYQSACWTSAMIADLIHLRFKVEYNPRYICHLLSALGLSYQRAKFSTDHLGGDTAIAWLEEVWPEIVRLAEEKHGLILFGDEASFAQWGSLSYTWALKGVQPTVPTCGIRKAYRVFGLFAPFAGPSQGRFVAKGTSGKLNSESYQAFLAWALDQVAGFLILIQDNASYHTSGPVQDFVRAHADRLAVYQLPPYSPELNPIERVWKKAKKGTHLRYFPTFASLVSRVEQTLTDLASKPHELTNLLGEYRDLMPTAA